ncbi:hypothetical protein [Streptosporangium sp. NPDC000396]|uniref:hypothetical protein n=1 Tax=Streptosporangium sp. NPDC000396 TaxID=3366185 RepID=UPI0036BCA025
MVAEPDRTQVNYAILDQRYRAIQWQLLVALAAGLAVGGAGAALTGQVPASVLAVYASVACFLLVAVVGSLATGLGWALANSALATMGILMGKLSVVMILGGVSSLRLTGVRLDIGILMWATIGVLAYLIRRKGIPFGREWCDAHGLRNRSARSRS